MTDTVIEPDPGGFVSIADAARHVGLSPWTIRDRIRSGGLTAYKTGRKHNAAVRVRLTANGPGARALLTSTNCRLVVKSLVPQGIAVLKAFAAQWFSALYGILHP